MTSPGCAVPITAPPGASADRRGAARGPRQVPVLYTVDTAVVAALAFSAGTASDAAASGSAEDHFTASAPRAATQPDTEPSGPLPP